ncbi:MAG: hypothetical protein ACOY45_07510 [Pseudomonadota bacterium]
MKRVLVALIAGTVLSGIAAAYATTTQHIRSVATADDGFPRHTSPVQAADATIQPVSADRVAAN